MNESRDKFQTEAQNDDDPNHVGNGFPPRLWQRSSLRHSFALRISCVLIQHVGDVLSEGLIASRRPVAYRLLVSLIARTVRPRNFTHDPFDGKETRKRAVVVSQRFPSGGIASPGSRVAQEALSVKKGIIALPLDWDRRGRVTPAGTTSQETWPGAEPRCESCGESRCGAPEGERAPQADELRKPRTLVCGAHPRPRCRRTATCVGAARTNSFAPFGASLPRLFRGTESNRPRTLTRRENDPC
jgi:hypothetical protein